MPKPACVPCGRFFRPERNGAYVAENMPAGQAAPGQPDGWLPYKVWSADIWRCEGCGARIVDGYGRHPVAEHFEPDFATARACATVVINDC